MSCLWYIFGHIKPESVL
jgi:hypothetical protein